MTSDDGAAGSAAPQSSPGSGRPEADRADGDLGPEVRGMDEDVAEAEIVGASAGDAHVGAPTEQATEDAVAEAVELARRFEAERDEYLDHLRRLQAEFENYKRRTDSQRGEQRAQAALDLVRELLPVLDACDAALSHGHEQVEPLRSQLLATLEKQGLAPVTQSGVEFDPNIHEAVMHESGDGDAVVAEVLRAGYLWNERVVRAAMVKVRG